VVVNHALLFASIAQNRSVLGAFDTLVVDEAHQIERVASQYLGVVLEERGVRETVHLVAALKPKETGLVNAFRHALNRALRDDSERERASRWLDALKDAAQQTAAAARQFFASVAEAFAPEDSSNGRSVRPRIRIRNSLAQRVPDAFERFERSLDTLKRELAEGVGMAREWDLDTRPDSEALGRELETVLERAGTLLESLVHFRGVDFEKHAVWIEFVDTERGREPILHSVPIEVASLLANRLYPRVRRGVWTSATLTVGDRFDYLMVRWGLNWVEPDRCTTRVFGSPFDFREQALLAVTTFLSNPRERRYVREVAAVLGRVLVEHPRGTLVLFTSYAMLREVYEAVRPVLDERGIRLLGQGIDGSRSFLLRMFQSDVRSVLFGTSSFWEGIDVPGAALELLVITKIPFDVPTDPLIEARMEKVQAETGNGFLHYAVPEAVVKLRQGFGRLIRTAEDRGAVLVLDPRVTQTAYGPLFLKSLPVEPALCDDESSLFSTLKEWFC
jgi:ATP-dependent DNA helicase DinG